MRILFYQLTATVVCSWLLLSSAAADTKPPAKIPIGVICALSGESSYGGQAHLTGIHLAVDDFNASHGNVQIELISRDDEGRPSKAKAEFDDLVNQQRVWAVMGSCNSGNTLAIAPMAEKQAVPLITSISAASEITHQGYKFVFRTSTSNQFQMHLTVEYLVDYLKLARFAVVFEAEGKEGETDAYGVGLKNDFLGALNDDGITPSQVLQLGYVRNQGHFDEDARKIAAADYQAVGLFGLVGDAVAIARALKKAKVKAVIFGGTGIAALPFVQRGGEDVDGTIVFSPFYPYDSRWDVFRFADRYYKTFNRYPDTYAAQAYDAMQVVLTAIINNIGTTTDLPTVRKNLRNYIANTQIAGVTGHVAFNAANESEPMLQILVADNGRLIPLRTRDCTLKDRGLAERKLFFEIFIAEGVILAILVITMVIRRRFAREETLREPGTSHESGIGSAILLLGGIMASMGALYWVVPSFPETLAAIIILLSITLIGVRVNLPQPLLDLLKHLANVLGVDITHDSDRTGEASTPKPRGA